MREDKTYKNWGHLVRLSDKSYRFLLALGYEKEGKNISPSKVIMKYLAPLVGNKNG